jgi:hypothetical protein
MYRGVKKYIHILRKEKNYENCNTQYIPITKDKYKSRLTVLPVAW